MHVEIVVALIALVAAIWSAVVGVRGQARLRRLERSLDEDQRLRQVVERYQEPLVRAAFELQSRLWNIARAGFLTRYHVKGERGEQGIETKYAVDSTIWLVAQYFCWVELLRREAQFLRLQRDDQTVRLQELLDNIAHTFGTDALDQPLRVFRSEQRAIGELMVIQGWDSGGAGRTDSLGYAGFCSRLDDPTFERWFASLRADVSLLADQGGRSVRLIAVQRLFIDFIDLVDDPPIRFTRDRGKIQDRV